MKKNLPIYILLVFLMAMNGFFLYTHFKGDKKTKPRPPRDFITKELNFDKAQTQKFEQLESKHRAQVREISEDIRELKNNLFDKISDVTINEKEIDSITSLIAVKEKERDVEVFHHFRSISKLCNDEQKEKLAKIVKKARRKRGKGHRSSSRRR